MDGQKDRWTDGQTLCDYKGISLCLACASRANRQKYANAGMQGREWTPFTCIPSGASALAALVKTIDVTVQKTKSARTHNMLCTNVNSNSSTSVSNHAKTAEALG